MKWFVKFLVRNIPRPVLIKFSYIFSWMFSVFYKGNNVECPVCEGTFRKFMPYGNKGEDNRLCPKCLSLERHRLIWLYLKNKTDFFTGHYKVLHIAPEQPFLKRFRALKNLDYQTADLLSPIADIKLDIRNMPLEDNSYDIVICNHVLEHIDDEHKAITEVYRVLRKGGFAILQVPMDYSRETTFEDPSIQDRRQREAIFGQYDHLRVHGKDYPDRLAQGGFVVEENKLVKELGIELIARYRLPEEEILYVSRKA